ncbi:MAG TPA: DEAD/DEAH box helicase [Candidatus Pacearchaeota archaeon]|nr:DEAD-box ATP-dependent RNA helicase CshA [archaeon BMS3Abin17]HDK42060.1 DEAD/DEAH box helicase [Candidatus Pacearchaeota archaeon]HDZ61256.1 DEAD/DEAH box helicase [Candidatus Pacearchaeota archaeon]
MKTFRELGLSREFVSLLERARIATPTEIQEKTIPLVLAGRDVIGGSATGSGKTLVFASGIIENLERNGRVQALVLTPTRELAEQVANAITEFSKYKKLKVLPVYGGVSIEHQIRFLRNTDVVVGTPGRILDHLSRNTLNLEMVKFLVLDEVDRMFDMGFQNDVEKILGQCPKERQTMLFSATISSEIDHLAKKHTKNPAEVSVESHVDASKLKQVYYDVPDGLKFSLFVHLLKKENARLVMVFCATRRNVDFVTNNLNNLGIRAKAIHGGMVQNKRNKVMNEFNSQNGVSVLVCTDVAARGLDIQGVSHVYNYDLSKTSDEYIHRIGRTARAGKEGIAISILCSRDYENFSNIQRDEKLKIEEVKAPYVDRIGIIVDDKKSFGRRGGHGSSRGKSFGRERSNGRRTNTGRRPQSNNRKPSGKNYSRGRSNSSRRNNNQRHGRR